jgi:two-component system response regulator AtoC
MVLKTKGCTISQEIPSTTSSAKAWSGEDRRSRPSVPIHDVVVLVDHDLERAAEHSRLLAREGIATRTVQSFTDDEALQTSAAVVVVLPETLEDERIDEFIETLREKRPELPVIMLAEPRCVDDAIKALRAGVFDFIKMPVNPDVFLNRVRRAVEFAAAQDEIETLRRQRVDVNTRLIGSSPVMKALRGLVDRVASSDVTVLVQGETGSGKEPVVRTIHEKSVRKDKPFIGVNCAAISPMLLEAELFGHVRGAFTDAKSSREGIFVQASGGTLFLDEIGDMTLEMQAKLLRALQERKIRPVGGNIEVAFDTRIISATHRDLSKMVQEGRFREDLLYRLNIVTIHVPPLRARGRDIVELASRMLARAAVRDRRSALRLTPAVVDRLLAYDWPGNVRELENCMERLVALAPGYEVNVDDLSERIRVDRDPIIAIDGADALISLDAFGDRYLRKVVKLFHGDRTAAAEILHIDRRTLTRRLDGAEISDERSQPSMAAPSLA